MANPRLFTINSDYPMPAQTFQQTVSVPIPAGVSNGGASQANVFAVNIEVPVGTQITRLNIESGRTGVTTVGNRLVQYYSDGTFVAFVQNIDRRTIRCTVLITSGFEPTKTVTESANDFTFSVSGFRVP